MMGSDLLRAAMCRAPGGVRPQDVFAVSLYTGNDSSQTITNGINLSGEGGLVWLKARNAGQAHKLVDSVRGLNNFLSTNDTSASDNNPGSVQSFNSNGFSLGSAYSQNTAGTTYAALTFRRAPKFFDVVTYTGNGTAGRTIAHNLGLTPGMVIVKRTDSADNWIVRHRSASGDLYLDLTSSAGGSFSFITAASGTNFTVGSNGAVNGSGGTYVAYLFAHDTDSSGVVQCGSYTHNTSASVSVSLGWRPQLVMVKRATGGTGDWVMSDSTRGIPAGGDPALFANLSSAETSSIDWIDLSADGFNINPASDNLTNAVNGNTVVYLAIREPT